MNFKLTNPNKPFTKIAEGDIRRTEDVVKAAAGIQEASNVMVRVLEAKLREVEKEFAIFKNDKINLLNKYIRENKKLKRQIKELKK